jgi:hypothetical protein
MINQQLLVYIKQQLAAGVAKADLQKTVLGAGWPAPDVSDTFAAAEGRAPAPAAPAPAPAMSAPIMPVQPAPVRPVAQPALARQELNKLQPARRLWLWVFVIFVAIVVGAAGVLYAIPDLRAQVLGYIPFINSAPAPVAQEPVPVVPKTQTITGEYVYASSTQPGYFLLEKPATAASTTPEVRYTFGAQDAGVAAQLVGTSTPKAGCSIDLEASLEVKNSTPLGNDPKIITLQTEFISVISRGKVFDICPGKNGSTKTERK